MHSDGLFRFGTLIIKTQLAPKPVLKTSTGTVNSICVSFSFKQLPQLPSLSLTSRARAFATLTSRMNASPSSHSITHDFEWTLSFLQVDNPRWRLLFCDSLSDLGGVTEGVPLGSGDVTPWSGWDSGRVSTTCPSVHRQHVHLNNEHQ